MCTAGDSEVNSSEFPLGNHKSEYDLCRDTPIPDRMKAGGQKMLVVHGGGGATHSGQYGTASRGHHLACHEQ